VPSGGAFASIDVALTAEIAQPTKRWDWLPCDRGQRATGGQAGRAPRWPQLEHTMRAPSGLIRVSSGK
jgi:hypothetical protein